MGGSKRTDPFALLLRECLRALREQEITELLDVKSGPAVARAVNDPKSIGEPAFDDGGTQCIRSGRLADAPIRRSIEGNRLACDWMFEHQLSRVEKHAPGRCAAIKRVTEDRETILGRVDADLVRPASDRFGFNDSVADIGGVHREMCLGTFTAGVAWPADVFLAGANEG